MLSNLTKYVGKFASVISISNSLFIPPGSTSSSASDHWLIRLIEGSKRGTSISVGPSPCLALPTQVPNSPELPVYGDEPSQVIETSRSCLISNFTIVGIRFEQARNSKFQDSVPGMSDGTEFHENVKMQTQSRRG